MITKVVQEQTDRNRKLGWGIIICISVIALIALVTSLRQSPDISTTKADVAQLQEQLRIASQVRADQAQCVSDLQAQWSVAIGDALVAQRLQPDPEHLAEAAQRIFRTNEQLRDVKHLCFASTTTTTTR